MGAAKYREMMVKKVFSEIRRKMPWAKNLLCQQDGAAGKGNVAKLNAAELRKRKRSHGNITMLTQPAQSPDTIINDLAIFPSMSKRFNKKQKYEKISDLDRLANNARNTWHNFPTEVLTKAWGTKTNVLKAIIKAGGKNNFKFPHAKDLDWEAMFEEWEEEKSESQESESSS